MKIETNNLMSVKNYANKQKVTTSYVYKLERTGRMELFVIDGVKFVNAKKYPTLPVASRR